MFIDGRWTYRRTSFNRQVGFLGHLVLSGSGENLTQQRHQLTFLLGGVHECGFGLLLLLLDLYFLLSDIGICADFRGFGGWSRVVRLWSRFESRSTGEWPTPEPVQCDLIRANPVYALGSHLPAISGRRADLASVLE